MNILYYYLRLLLFWMLFFLTQRELFLLIHFSSLHAGSYQIILCNLKALPMDLSASLYLISIPVVAGIVSFFINKNEIINRIARVQSYIFIVICVLISAGDIGMYKVWGTKINAKALSYLAYPKEVLPTLFASENIFLLILIITEIIVFIWLFKKIYRPIEIPELPLFKKIIFSILIVGSFIIGIRGGVQRVPINRNWVFFSPHSSLNFAALNGFWNFADLFFKPMQPQTNPYTFFSDKEAKDLLKEMHKTTSDSTEIIINTRRPNVILVMLESWAGDVVECINGDEDITPKFCELAKEGLLFTKFYSTGYRTEQGMLAIMSGYPAQPVSSIIQEFGKFDKLPNIYKTFNDTGYATSYYCGGRLQFDNIESYLHAAGVQKMIGEDDFTIRKRTFWGAYDDEIYAKQLQDLDNEKEPFFSTLSTNVTHEWFDADVPKIYHGDSYPVNDNYRNTMHYADSCLFEYIRTAKTKPWYKNTLFIFVADHSCQFPKARSNFDPERHHIPMLMTGGALLESKRGKHADMVGSHTDIAATLFAQMKLSSSPFPRSKNLFNSSIPKFAYYAFDNGFGIVNENNQLVYDHNQQKSIIEKNPADNTKVRLLNYGKAYLQTNFQENIDYAVIKSK